ncbi:hypothetical protein [uncultured Algibacter sp.]|uniref:hypothetical protein n=1 Tax=uncultured Algibacter sp. TaxID=298659 RepID=UPI0026340B4D|nr:hypothetical protein [uncultured Algibacter sp.]
MKKSIKLFSLISLLFFAADRIVYNTISSIDKQVFTGQTGGKVNQFLTLKDSVNLLVFGNSRASHHLDTKLLDSISYNAGADGSRIGYSTALVSVLEKKEQTILVHIDHWDIYDSEYKGKDVLSFLSLASKNEDISRFISEIHPKEIYTSKIFNCYVYNGKFLSLLKNYFSPKYDVNHYYGYDPLTPNQEQKEIFKKLIDKTDFKNFNYSDSISILPNPIVDSFIEKIKVKCKKNNSKLVFFTSPTLKNNQEGLLLKTKEYFNSKGVIYYDYSKFIDISDVSNWQDFTHMSEKGANLFTKKIKEDILN